MAATEESRSLLGGIYGFGFSGRGGFDRPLEVVDEHGRVQDVVGCIPDGEAQGNDGTGLDRRLGL